MKKLLKFSILIVFLSFFISSSALAATPAVKATPTEAILLASVNIQDAKIISQKNNVFNISFSLSNREGLQTGVKYGVKLIKETTTGGQFIVNEKIYDESLTLNPNTTLKQEITYIAPTYLNGSYTLLLVSNNTSGFPFSIVNVGKVTLTSTSFGVQILPEACSLQVVGEKNNPQYTLDQGVDIKSEENLKLTCTAINSSKSDLTITPAYETRYRSTYGDVVPQKGGDTGAISFKAGEKKSFSVVLPKATSPQAYNVDLTLNSGDSKSNPVSVHYVLRGASATIQKVSLDKDYYTKGDQAKVSFIYTPSADSFEGSRFGKTALTSVTSTLEMTNGKGKSCADTQTKDLTNYTDISVDTPLSITSSCIDPIITVVLKDASGTILDQKVFNVKTTSIPAQKSNSIIYIIVILALILIAIIITYLKKKNTPSNGIEQNNIPMGVIFFLLIAIASFIPIGKVSADTFAAGTRYVVFGIDKSDYAPNATITGNGVISDASCLNYRIAGTVIMKIETQSKLIYNKPLGLPEVNMGAPTLVAPSSSGSYNALFTARAYIDTTTVSTGPHYEKCTSNCNLAASNYWTPPTGQPPYNVWTQWVSGDKWIYISTPTSVSTDNYASGSGSTPYTVTAPVPMTVQTFINGSTAPLSITKSVATTTGVTVKWDSHNATSCDCTTSAPYTYIDSNNNTQTSSKCGSGIGIGVSGKTPTPSDNTFKFSNTTTFSVVCNDNPFPAIPGTQYWFKLYNCQDPSNYYEAGPYSDYRYSTSDLVEGTYNNGTTNFRVVDSATSSYGLPNTGGESKASNTICSPI